MKQSPPQAHVAQMLGPLEGERVEGGCLSCNAHQTVEPVSAGVWQMLVHHDAGCPVLAKHERRRKG